MEPFELLMSQSTRIRGLNKVRQIWRGDRLKWTQEFQEQPLGSGGYWLYHIMAANLLTIAKEDSGGFRGNQVSRISTGLRPPATRRLLLGLITMIESLCSPAISFFEDDHEPEEYNLSATFAYRTYRWSNRVVPAECKRWGDPDHTSLKEKGCIGPHGKNCFLKWHRRRWNGEYITSLKK
ncbi:hypothetical protein SDJN02_27401, partial [Cucurbita argyrosperma subsp. argyrosperma]